MISLFLGGWAAILSYLVLFVVVPKFLKALMLLATVMVVGSVVVMVYRWA